MRKIVIVSFVISLFSSLCFSQTWEVKLPGNSMYGLAIDKFGGIYGVSASPRNAYRSLNGGIDWDTILVNTPSAGQNIAVDSSLNIYVSNQSNGLFKSTNGGLNWTQIPVSVFNNFSVQCVCCGKNGWIYVGTSNGGVFRSTDYGATFPVSSLSGILVVMLKIDRFNPNYIYAGGSGVSSNFGFFFSTDAGSTWSDNTNPINNFDLAQSSNGDIFTVSTSTGFPLSKSTNHGLNWTTIYSFGDFRRGICIDSRDYIYTSGNSGIYRSSDGGVSFLSWNVAYSSQKVVAYQNKVFLAVSGNTNGGVYIYTDTTLSNVNPVGKITPVAYSLFQNYPNPFNPTTNIQFDIPKSSYVKLKIFDMLGKEITTLVNDRLQAGSYRVNWNASQYSNGVYYYNITAGDFSKTRKMILIK